MGSKAQSRSRISRKTEPDTDFAELRPAGGLPRIELTLLVGLYAQRHFLKGHRKPSLAATIEAWREYSPTYLPLPHPSPRNTPWLQRHSWFERQLLPELRSRVGRSFST